jgi:hypothetical protein
MLRLLILCTAMMIALTILWLSAATGGWLFHHVAPFVQNRWFRPVSLAISMVCSAFATIYVIVATQKRRKAQTEE